MVKKFVFAVELRPAPGLAILGFGEKSVEHAAGELRPALGLAILELVGQSVEHAADLDSEELSGFAAKLDGLSALSCAADTDSD